MMGDVSCHGCHRVIPGRIYSKRVGNKLVEACKGCASPPEVASRAAPDVATFPPGAKVWIIRYRDSRPSKSAGTDFPGVVLEQQGQRVQVLSELGPEWTTVERVRARQVKQGEKAHGC